MGPTDQSRQSVERGRSRLMLKLPELRSNLSKIKEPWLDELCEAYDLASTALEHFRHSSIESDQALIPEYEILCREIEADILRELSG